MSKERRNLIIKSALTIILLSVLAFFIYKDRQTIAATFSGMLAEPGRLWWFVLGTGLFFLSNITGFIVWRLAFLGMGVKADSYTVFRTFLLGMFYNNLLPTSIGGDVVKVIEMRDADVKTDHVVASVLVDRVMSAYMLGLIGLISASVLLHDKIPTYLLLSFYGALAVGTLSAGILLYNERSFAFLVKVVKKIIPWKKAGDFIVSILTAFHKLKTKRRYTALLVLIVFITQTLRIVNNFFASLALGIDIPMFYFFVITPVVGYIAMLPITIGGVGSGELVGGGLFLKVLPKKIIESQSISVGVAGSVLFAGRFTALLGNALCAFAFLLPKKYPRRTQKDEDSSDVKEGAS